MNEATLASVHGAMRRKDREITDPKEIETLLYSENLMHLALADQNVPFVVPLFYAYDGRALYFHSAKAGTKTEILKRNSLVCFEISRAEGVIDADSACDFEARHKTVVGLGRASFVEDLDEKKRALDAIVARFSTRKFEYPQANFACALVVRIDIVSMKGKKHGF